jgi:hypothetical protein
MGGKRLRALRIQSETIRDGGGKNIYPALLEMMKQRQAAQSDHHENFGRLGLNAKLGRS